MAAKISKEKKEKMKELERWFSHFQALQSFMDDMRELFGIMTEGRFENTVWGVFNDYTNLVSDKVGDDHHEWLDWFLWDNEAGKRAFEAQAASWTKPRPIKTLSDLYDVINDD